MSPLSFINFDFSSILIFFVIEFKCFICIITFIKLKMNKFTGPLGKENQSMDKRMKRNVNVSETL